MRTLFPIKLVLLNVAYAANSGLTMSYNSFSLSYSTPFVSMAIKDSY